MRQTMTRTFEGSLTALDLTLNPMLQDATQTPAWTVSGAAEFTQNLFTGSNTKCVHISRYSYTIEIYLHYLYVISTISTGTPSG